MPFGLIGETVEAKSQGEHLHYPVSGRSGGYPCTAYRQAPTLRLAGARARGYRAQCAAAVLAPALASAPRGVDNAEFEFRDLSVYEQLIERVGLEVMP